MIKNNKIGNTLTDSQLVHNFITHNDNRAFDELVKRYRDKVYNQIFFTVKDEDLANDLFQDTFVKVLIMLRDGKYNEEGKFNAWLMRVTSNIVMDYYRKKPVAVDSITPNDNPASDILNRIDLAEPSTEHTLVEQQVRDTAVKLMNALPEAQREILQMRFYQDLSFKEIAEQKGLSINTALGRMHYAVNNMRKLAKQHSVALSA